jgi:hypothetical protein
MTLESGPATKDRNWQLLRTVIFLGFAAWFLWDGVYRYPHENRTQAEEWLQGHPSAAKISFDALGDAPVQADLDRLRQAKVATRPDVLRTLGTPTVSDTQNGDDYFISRYGYIKRPGSGEPTWHSWGKTKAEITGQYYWALVPALLALPFAWKLYRAVTLRVVVDDQGLTYAGRRIAFADVVSLRDYEPKGWIDLYYQSGDRQRKLRLDNEKIARFDEIVEAICQAKGFRNEVRAYAEQQAREEAAEASGTADAEAAESPADADRPADAASGGSLLEEEYPKEK